MSVVVRRLGAGDIGAMRAVNALFAREFDDANSYQSSPPGEAYLQAKLGNERTLVLAAFSGEELVGALVALYEKLGSREDVMHFDIEPRVTR